MSSRFKAGTLAVVALIAAVTAVVVLPLVIGANGEADEAALTPTPGSDVQVSPTPSTTQPPIVAPTTPAPDGTVSATPGANGQPAPTVPPLPTLEAGRERFAAPIDGLDVIVRESFPPQYVAQIKAGLPNGCARAAGYELERVGDEFRIRVYDSQPSGAVVCTAIYGMYDLSVELGSDLVSGTTYTVNVNGKVVTFTAQ